MLVIALDTSTPAVTAGLVVLDDGGPRSVAERVAVNPRAHGELLMPHLLAALDEAGRRLADVDAIVVGDGPGPFTGLRVGMVTAAALGQALDVPVHPVCGLDAIAVAAGHDGPLLVATDARRKEVYWAAYDAARTRTGGPAVQRPADVPVDGYAVAAGESAEALGLTAVEPRHPAPAGLVAVAAAELRAGAEPAPLVPRYLRRPDAAEPAPRKPVGGLR
ncbi:MULTISPECIES: tRNA (adenosine(37)-N6)-threonylcarbamoyltransferase complex dimerization subunit type 1 TsaB [Saccharopolyspora]|uniref:tRNA (Adenosine(37)-N6)-threonylcarbamoyltransferase complex dimerization subunit type 1 TsaB n=1 Tax=Saccharopolyspora cebuensis TaxID=418759 RepID=A0ABV4CVA8_9PSEU